MTPALSRRASFRSTYLAPITVNETTPPPIALRGALTLTGVASQGLLRFLAAAMVGHVAGPEALGAFSAAIALATFASLLWPTSAGGAASKFLARERGAGDLHLTRSVAALLATRTWQTALVLGALASVVWIMLDGHPESAWAVGVFVLGYSGYSFTRGVLYGLWLIPRATLWDVTSSLVGLAVMAGCLALGARSVVLLAAVASSYLLFSAAGWPYLRADRPPRPLRREIDGFVALATVGTMTSTGFIQLTMLAVQQTSSKEATGMYAAAMTLATPASLLASSLSLLLVPALAEAWGRRDIAAFRTQTDTGTRLLLTVMVAIFGCLALLSRPMTNLIWGSRFGAAEQVLPILFAAVLVSILDVPAVSALTTESQRGTAINMASSVAGLILGAASWFVFVPMVGGPMGIAIGYVIGMAVNSGVALYVTARWHHHRWLGMTVSLLAAIAAVGTACVFSQRQHWGLPLELASAACFLVAWLTLRHRDLQLARQLIRR